MSKIRLFLPSFMLTAALVLPQGLFALGAPKVTLVPKVDGSVTVGLSIVKAADLKKLKGGLIQVQRSIGNAPYQALVEIKKPKKKKISYRDVPGVEGTIRYRARAQVKKLRSKYSKAAAVALPYQTPVPNPTATPGSAATPTPRPTATPTSIPSGNTCSGGNTTGFGIPNGITGHGSTGNSLYLVNCSSCHNSSFIRNKSYSTIYASRNRSDMTSVKTFLSSAQNSADITAKANCP